MGMLASAPPQEQKQMLGERLFPLIQGMYPELAGKITGMLLEIDNSELVHMLESQESLKGKVRRQSPCSKYTSPRNKRISRHTFRIVKMIVLPHAFKLLCPIYHKKTPLTIFRPQSIKKITKTFASRNCVCPKSKKIATFQKKYPKKLKHYD